MGYLDDPAVLVALVGLFGAIIGGLITAITQLRTNIQNKRAELRRAEREFVQGIIQKTIEQGTADEQIRNMRSYAEIGIIGEPYADKILALKEDQLPSLGSLQHIRSDPSGNLSIGQIEQMLRAARAVGLIELNGKGAGTGFLIGFGIMLTMRHLLVQSGAWIQLGGTMSGRSMNVRNGRFVLDYQSTTTGESSAPQHYYFEPDTLFLENAALDIAIVAISERSEEGTPNREYGYILGAGRSPGEGDRVNLIHHARGEQKSVAMRDGRVCSGDQNYLYYLAASAMGSSGAPVLDDWFGVIAVHRAAIPRKDDGGRWLDRDGRPIVDVDGRPRRQLAAEEVDWATLQGVRWSAIESWLKQTRSDREAFHRLSHIHGNFPPGGPGLE